MKIMIMINHPTGGVLATVAKLHCRCFKLLPGVHIFQIYNHPLLPISSSFLSVKKRGGIYIIQFIFYFIENQKTVE